MNMNHTPNVVYLEVGRTDPHLNDFAYTRATPIYSPNSIVGLFVLGSMIWNTFFGG